MPVDIVGDSKNLNVHDLVISPERRQDIGFDPKKDLTPFQWNGVKDYINDRYASPQDKHKMMSYLRILDPEIKLPDEFARMKSVLPTLFEKSNLLDACDKIFALRVLYPERLKEIYPYENDRLEHLNYLKYGVSKRSDSVIEARYLITMALSFPKDHKRIGDHRAQLEEQMERYSNDPFKLAHILTAARILYPDSSWNKYLQFPYQWQSFKDELQKRQPDERRDWPHFAYYACLLTILSSQKIEVGRKSFIQGRFKKSEPVSDKPIPERRKY